MENREQQELTRFVEAVSTLTADQQRALYWRVTWIFFKATIKHPSWETIKLAADMFCGLVWPDIRAHALPTVLVIVATGLWFVTLWRMSH